MRTAVAARRSGISEVLVLAALGGYRQSLTAYHPGMAVTLSGVREELRKAMARNRSEAAEKARRAGQGA
jgi:hypothetical protein